MIQRNDGSLIPDVLPGSSVIIPRDNRMPSRDIKRHRNSSFAKLLFLMPTSKYLARKLPLSRNNPYIKVYEFAHKIEIYALSLSVEIRGCNMNR